MGQRPVNKKIPIDGGYITHLTLKWKDLAKKEDAIVHVAGMSSKKPMITLVLVALGEGRHCT